MILSIFKYLLRNRLQVDIEDVKPVYLPVLDFENLMKSEPSKVFGNFRGGYMRYKSGQMKYSESMHMKFSCHFNFHLFPFDSQKCCIDYRMLSDGIDRVKLNRAIVTYGGNKTTRDGPFELGDLPFPFHLEIESMPMSTKFDTDRQRTFSYTGMCFKITRTKRGHLISGYYHPTAAFAFLSTISYLIKPDIVSMNLF